MQNSELYRRRIMRLPEVESVTGYKRSYIYRLIQQGNFPRQKQIGQRSVGWDSLEIQHWVNERLGAVNG